MKFRLWVFLGGGGGCLFLLERFLGHCFSRGSIFVGGVYIIGIFIKF